MQGISRRILATAIVLTTLVWLSGVHVHEACLKECHDLVVEVFACGHDVGPCEPGADGHECDTGHGETRNVGCPAPEKRIPDPGKRVSFLPCAISSTPGESPADRRIRDDGRLIRPQRFCSESPRSPPVPSCPS